MLKLSPEIIANTRWDPRFILVGYDYRYIAGIVGTPSSISTSVPSHLQQESERNASMDTDSEFELNRKNSFPSARPIPSPK